MDSSQRVRAIISLVHAVDAGSFAAAGRMLGVTSAAIGKNVASLEKALGVRLMNRTTRTLKLTEEGEAFLGQARVALEALDAAADAIAARRAAPGGRVRISTNRPCPKAGSRDSRCGIGSVAARANSGRSAS